MCCIKAKRKEIAKLRKLFKHKGVFIMKEMRDSSVKLFKELVDFPGVEVSRFRVGSQLLNAHCREREISYKEAQFDLQMQNSKKVITLFNS